MGMCNEFKQKEVKKFIVKEKFQIYALLETHLKTKGISKTCDRVFGRWKWISNIVHSPTSCRVVVGWNFDVVDDGGRFDGHKVPEQFVNHFKNFLGSSLPILPLSSLRGIVKLKLTSDEANDMVSKITDEEIKSTIKKSWQIIGKHICLEIKEFFSYGKILGEINVTLIALVPKIDTHYKVSDFRFIACCNVLYKGIRNEAKRCAMKIDIQKAYDTISWELLNEVSSFKGDRGLRQGDPISPYSFTLVIELKLTRMCFVDDLMVLCNGDKESLKVVKKSLEEFTRVSGFVIKDLEKFFKTNLWNPGNFIKWKAWVAWNLVCMPKDQGGLGIKPLKK
ncbi:RNA-directed DNA polymerase, eukaryota, reverse transcriptase zinc-binding domain protein [Tanacetum coccineum]